MDDLADVDNAAVAGAVGQVEPEFRPGARYEYSNTAYALAGLLIMRVSGQSYPEFLKGAVFGPAGLEDTEVIDRPGRDFARRVTGYRHTKKGRVKVVRNDSSVMGDGQVLTSARDMVRWDKALRAGAIVSRELAKRAFTSGRLNSGKASGYGFGWSADEEYPRMIEHAGSWDGTSTFVRIYLDGPSIVILSNDEDADPESLADAIEALVER